MSAGSVVHVVGAGLAGCEAAWQAARFGASVRLYEMKPKERSPAHSTDEFAELVCSNSLRGAHLGVAVGLLKEEMRRIGSLVLRTADETAIPAGRALAVDRTEFSRRLTEAVTDHPRIEVVHQRVDQIPEEQSVILATGPLTAPALAAQLQAIVGEESLAFYDAVSPIVYADSIDMDVVFRASRWEDGDGDYLNVPLDEHDYSRFVAELVAADTVPLHSFEAKLYFEGCLPIEEMARRGPKTLSFGPLKPVGLVDPRTGRRPHAVLQLRQEDKRGVLYNLVGCQTKLRISDQRRLLRSLPGLGEAVFARFGSVHRNTYLNAPRHLTRDLTLRERPGVRIAGQMAGVEGYVESAALGLLAGLFAGCELRGVEAPEPDVTTAHGALLTHLRDSDARHFQPSNVTYGLVPPLPRTGPKKIPKRDKNRLLAERALESLGPFQAALEALEVVS